MQQLRMSRVMWLSHFIKRSFSASPAASPLAILRKRTGYSLSKCKEALLEANNDIELAQVKLKEQAQREGWVKSEQSRVTPQGVIGTFVDGKRATMIEINCETDFVAKNVEFLKYVSQIIQVTADVLKLHPQEATPTTRHLQSRDLLSFGPTSNGHPTLGDLTAENIGLFGEKIALSRGCHMIASNDTSISSFSYNGIELQSGMSVGKYGCLVHLQGDNSNDYGTQLAQHVVGMNPRTIGGGDEHDLLLQDFIFEPGMTVEAWLKSHDLRVNEFIRYGVGENSDK